MKKIIITTFIAIMLVVFIGCNTENKSNDLLTSENEIYGFSAISSINLLGNIEGTEVSTNYNTSTTLKRHKEDVNEISEEEIEEINKYLTMVEQLLNDKPLNVEEIESDKVEYQFKTVITTKDLSNNEITYTLYYNEQVTTEEEFDDDEIDKEIETSLEGILIVGKNEYQVYGEREFDGEELELEFTARLDAKNWVKVKQETEDNETMFKYTISENGKISSTMIKVANEDNKNVIHLHFTDGRLKSHYMFREVVEEGVRFIMIKVMDSNIRANIKVRITIDPETNEEVYEYKYVETGKVVKKDRHNPKDFPKIKDKHKGM